MGGCAGVRVCVYVCPWLSCTCDESLVCSGNFSRYKRQGLFFLCSCDGGDGENAAKESIDPKQVAA